MEATILHMPSTTAAVQGELTTGTPFQDSGMGRGLRVKVVPFVTVLDLRKTASKNSEAVPWRARI